MADEELDPGSPEAQNALMVKRASRLIRAYEVGGGVQTEEAIEKGFASHKIPGLGGRSPGEVHIPSNSGATLGFGHDIGQASKAEVETFYGHRAATGGGADSGADNGVLTPAERETLKDYAAIGNITKKKKRKAAMIATQGIDLTYDEATQVFEKHLLTKKGIEAARAAFPGFDNLPALQQAAIVDRVYMRGPGMSKREKKLGGAQMLADLKQAVFQLNTKEVYLALKRMERLHTKSSKQSSTQARARERTALAYEGYLQTTRLGPH